MSVYGYLAEANPVYDYRFDDIVLEFDIKETIRAMKYKIKQAIVRFIDRINGVLDKHPNSKLAMGLKNILSKAKNLLTKTDEADNDKDIQKVKEEFDNLKQEAEDLKYSKVSEEFKKICKDDNIRRARIIIKDNILTLKNDPEAFKQYLDYYRYSGGSNDRIEVDKDDGEFNAETEDDFNTLSVELINNFSIEKLNALIKLCNKLYNGTLVPYH